MSNNDKKRALKFKALIAKGEGRRLEFKSTLRVSLDTGRPGIEIEYSVLKTIAGFLNSEGGKLIVGVEDNRNIIGLENDFKFFKGQDKPDEFQQHFDRIFEKIGNRFQRHIEIEFCEVDSKVICIITVQKSDDPAYLKDEKGMEKFYIRRKASTVALTLSETLKYILGHWKHETTTQKNVTRKTELIKYTSEDVFREGMQRILADRNSIYYSEIKRHYNSYTLIKGCLFLKDIVQDSLSKSFGNGLLPTILDWSKQHLQNDREAKYLYNQKHIHLHNNEDEGFDLPVYYHIRFIGILYATAIINGVDIDRVNKRSQSKNMLSIYSGMIEGMIENLEYNASEGEKEYPTNYHWLIGEIFSIVSNWIRLFNEDEYFQKASSYLEYFSDVLRYCFVELYDGYEAGKISLKYIVSNFYFHVLTHYFSPLTNSAILDSLEENIIKQVPMEFVKPILKFALDEAFAIGLEDFYQNRGHLQNVGERRILKRLRDFLIRAGKI